MAQFPLIDQASIAMIPGAYKESKVYSQLPTDGSGDFTFSRGTDNATIVNEEGLIEKGYENVLLQSNNFDTTWLNTSANLTSGQAGYDGSNNAWLLESTQNAGSFIYQSVSQSGVQTLSVYAKAGTADYIYVLQIGSNAKAAYFDLTNGTTGNKVNNPVNSLIEDVGNGWYRCSLIVNDNTSSVRLYPADTNGNNVTNIGSNIYIQDAQLNQGLVAYPYLETTTAPAYGGITANQPRLNYTGDCPSLFVEEGRTNLFDNSEYFGSWSASRANSFLSNDVLSPEGKYNAFEIIQDTSFGNHFIRENFSTSVSGGLYTQSVYLKRKNRDNVTLRTLNTIPAESISFDLVNGTHNGGSHWFIEDAGDGWYRCGVTSTQSTSSGLFYIYAGGGGNYTGDGVTGVYAYGAQAELGTYATSYIPTYGSTQTRAAETLTATKTLPSEGTLYINVGGTTQPKLSVLGEFFDASTTENKVAIAYSATALKISHNGSIVVDKTGSYDVSSLTEIDLGHDGGTDQADTSIGEFITFGSFLTTTELNALTQ